MKAIVQDRYGTSDVLRLEDVSTRARPRRGPRPSGRPAVDRGTWHLMTGLPLAARLALGLCDRATAPPAATWPARSRASARAWPATRSGMYGTARGSFAALAVVPVTRLARRPASISVEAAAVPVSAVTALQALRAADVARGDRVLVVGASGGVGSYAVLAVDAVTGVCGPAKADLVRALGREHVVDHTTTPRRPSTTGSTRSSTSAVTARRGCSGAAHRARRPRHRGQRDGWPLAGRAPAGHRRRPALPSCGSARGCSRRPRTEPTSPR